jgi:hypothetical protein
MKHTQWWPGHDMMTGLDVDLHATSSCRSTVIMPEGGAGRNVWSATCGMHMPRGKSKGRHVLNVASQNI